MALPRILSFSLSCADAEQLAGFYTARHGFHRGETLQLEGNDATVVGLPRSRLKLIRLHGGRRAWSSFRCWSWAPACGTAGRCAPMGAATTWTSSTSVW